MTSDGLRSLAQSLRGGAGFVAGVLLRADLRLAADALDRLAMGADRLETATPETIHKALTEPDRVVGPACMYVPVPDTIAQDDAFREAYMQGYRHALNDVRAYLDSDTALKK